jgi:hypothetical protein
LYIIRNKALIGIKYRGEILHPIVRQFVGTIGVEFILMDDNARPYRANIVNQHTEAEAIVKNGMTCEVTRPKSYLTCLGCSIEADSATISGSIQY